MYYYGGSNTSGCGCNGGNSSYYQGGYNYPMYGSGYGYGGGYGSGAAIVLVLFILLVIIIGTRSFTTV